MKPVENETLDNLVTDFNDWKRYVISELSTIKEVEYARMERIKANERGDYNPKALV